MSHVGAAEGSALSVAVQPAVSAHLAYTLSFTTDCTCKWESNSSVHQPVEETPWVSGHTVLGSRGWGRNNL